MNKIRTPSPTASPLEKEFYIPDDQQVIAAGLFWFGLSLALCFVYALQRHYLPWSVVLRDMPWSTKDEGEGSCRESNPLMSFYRSVKRTLNMTEQELIHQCGLDGYLTIRLIRFCANTIAPICVFNLLVLAPIYHSQERPPKCDDYCASKDNSNHQDVYRAECVCGFIDECSLANVQSSSSVLWVTAFSALVFSLWSLYRLKMEYKIIVNVRHRFWLSRPSRLHTIFVDRIPRSLAPRKTLTEYFEKVFPGNVHRVEIMTPTDSLTKIGAQRMNTLLALERAIVIKSREGKSPSHWIWNGFKSCFSKVDSIEYYAQSLEELNSQFKLLKDHQSETEHSEEATRPRHAFVTFKTIVPAIISAQTLLQQHMAIKMAPNPNDVRWGALGDRNTAFTYFVRKTISRIVFGVVLVFWGAITSFIGALTSTEALSRQFPGLGDFLNEHPGFIYWLDRLSTFIYVILIALVYPIIALSVRIEVRIGQSNVERAILERYFLFLVLQVFVFYSIAGSVFKSVVEIAKSPSSIFSTLSATIPKNASFFIGFLAIKTFWLFFDLIRGYNFIFAVLRRMIFGSTLTSREFRYCVYGCWHFRFPSPVNLSSASASLLLVFFIAISYAAIQPLMALAALIYFASCNLVFSVVLTTSSRQLFDGGGIFWTHTYWCIISALATGQMTLVGTLLTKQGYSQALFVFFVMVFTFIMSSHLNDKYRGAATHASIEVATELDRLHDPGEGATERRVVEIHPDTTLAYGVLTQHEEDFEHVEEENTHGECTPHTTTKVYKYVHPVLLEQEFVAPQLPELTHGIRELGEASRGTTGGDLGYARMLDLDWESTGPPANSVSANNT